MIALIPWIGWFLFGAGGLFLAVINIGGGRRFNNNHLVLALFIMMLGLSIACESYILVIVWGAATIWALIRIFRK